MYAKWIAEDKVIRGEVVIKNGEIRQVHAKKDNLYLLEGRNGKGTYGWVNATNIKLMGVKPK